MWKIACEDRYYDFKIPIYLKHVWKILQKHHLEWAMLYVKSKILLWIFYLSIQVHVQYTGICLSKIGFYFLLVWLVMVGDVPISGGSTVSLFPCMWSSLNRGRSPTSLGRVTRSFSLKHSWKHISQVPIRRNITLSPFPPFSLSLSLEHISGLYFILDSYAVPTNLYIYI